MSTVHFATGPSLTTSDATTTDVVSHDAELSIIRGPDGHVRGEKDELDHSGQKVLAMFPSQSDIHAV